MDTNAAAAKTERKLSLVTSASGATADFQAILDKDRQRYEAMIDGDCARLEVLLDDALVYTHSAGRTEGKQDFLRLLGANPDIYQAVSRDAKGFVSFGEAVLMYGTVHMDLLTPRGPRTAECLFQSLWRRRDGDWKMASWAPTVL
ncbi:hypothetical protein PIGHUM_04702 [Pigmentiphaga humi]|uniref:DUF4440 domain-containing protein n=1 Tax=Pigmentiphaga humi TaxID=2478468 RepID=A0A3P4BAE4_9BURK|nr:nuclear transport factor 2 family protein [Pigmentiphaga humi]VCU72600.1 hypothetical protein PIGHUM_04702 [Pigmentiphaga humi]